MKISHQNFCFSAAIPEHVVHYSCVKIRKINLQSIKARLVTKESYRHIPLEESPHWQFLNGDEEPYQRYLQEFGKDVGLEHSPAVFRALIKEMAKVGYLDGDHGRGYVIVQREGDDHVIRDGFHRACILLHSGEQIVPMAVLDEPEDQIDLYFSTCVLYHFGEGFRTIMEQVSENHPMVFLQTNLGHGGALAEYASVKYHQRLLHELGYSVTVDAPEGYLYPAIIGQK